MVTAAYRARMKDLGDRISGLLDRVAGMFTEPVKITIIVRNPAHPDGSRDVYMTDDDPEIAIAAIRQALAAGIEITKGVD